MLKSNFIERSIMGALSFIKESVFADEYASARGFLQARDPRIKAISILLLLLLVLFSTNILFLICIYFICLSLASASKVNLWFFLKRTWFFIPFFALFIAIPAIFNIFTQGEAIVSFNIFGARLSITRQGVGSAVFFFTRVLTSVSLVVLLALTTRHNELLKALRVFRVPQIFVMTLGICYRYIYLFIEIIQNTYLAIKSRVGIIPSSGKGQWVVAWNIASLWQRSYHLQAEVYSAMLSRGYTGEPQLLQEFRTTSKDWVWLSGVVIFALIYIWKSQYLN